MNIIKLNATASTNLFLKNLTKNSKVENFTVVVANEQLAGKGQMNTVWYSEKGKNLLFTVYVALKGLPVALIPYISFLSALQIRKVISGFLRDHHAKIKIKWPNDILSYNDKVAGVLVENLIRKNEVVASFVGVGINVNQTVFPDFLPNASSMAKIEGVLFDKDAILHQIIEALQAVMHVDYIVQNQLKIKQQYLAHLYKIQTPAMFKDAKGCVFMGKIIDVNDQGLLVVETTDGEQKIYNIKEISFL